MTHTSHPSASAAQWLEGARPHTWANAISPVLAGTAAAQLAGGANFFHAFLALVVSLALIIGVNYANDYSDGIRGTDEDRSGPLRLTGSGLVEPSKVKYAAFASFTVAGIAGIVLSLLSAWWFILIGALCILGAWFYTGGKNPYGYRGLGEVAVFIFFGLVAVLGTEFTQAGRVSWVGLALAVTIGALSSSVNLANNLRDIPTDSETGKITLAVRLGDRRTRVLWQALVATAVVLTIAVGVVHPLMLIALAAGIFWFNAARIIRAGVQGRGLIPVLGITGRGMLIWALIVAVVSFV
ncbi:1,4-dihydroxy-2-naphthoate polyprenyltransferase [Corynebacterium dentalis]|uniref:1,4-dihydroxy-2-naphthoate polyprenyltransferase n=1 Tax=Corynebacterium dentalis TaxID=2014528 RepID=UPI000C06C87D|nr:1,4-dihydroxy-2-naphthoate polyprenyltransferase [Corynebacterium dentalis]